MTDESRERIDRLETATRRLLVEVAELRRELQAMRASGAAAAASTSAQATTETPAADRARLDAMAAEAPPADPLPAPQPQAPQSFLGRVLDPPRTGAPPRRPRPAGSARGGSGGVLPAGMTLEDLVGRYGAMVLAALAIMSGVGIFLSWAIAQNLIGPAVRVAAGFAVAAALAALGWRLRHRNARTFGNTLMGIALAVVHVVGWGAGPGLGVMPNSVALAIAAVASIALAVLAWRSGEESLFVVGVGGALIAPFVTTPGGGNGEALLTFGWLVLTLALSGMRNRRWSTARLLLGSAGIAYASAAMTAAWSTTGLLSQDAPTLFAIACAWGALVSGGPIHAPGLVRAYLVGGIAPLFWNWDKEGVFITHLILAAIATLTLFFATIRGEEEDTPTWMLWLLVLPLAYLAGALIPLDDIASARGALVAAGWMIAAAGAGFLVVGARREILWVVAALSAETAIVLALSGREIETVVALSALVAGLSLVIRRERAGMLLWPAAAGLTVAAGMMWIEFDMRAPYAYTPFLTTPSIGALAMVLAIAALGWNVARTELEDGPLSPRKRNAVQGLGIAAAFIWGHVELREAYSPDMAVFLLIIYYAACGVAAIFVGRRSALSDLRRVGLGLSIFAALKAVAQGYELDTVGLRVGSFLLVGAFLLAVAYWYRAAGDPAIRVDAHAGS